MGEWIYVNMKWGDDFIEDEERDKTISKLYDEMEKKIKEHFGTHSDEKYEELENFLEPWLKENKKDFFDFANYVSDNYKIMKQKSYDELWLKKVKKQIKDPYVIKLAEYRVFVFEEQKLFNSFEENKIIEELRKDIYVKGFSSREMNKPGVLIEFKSEDIIKQYIIGDINVNGGMCDCCSGINDDDIVLRYKNLLD